MTLKTVAAMTAITIGPLAAQWLNHPTAGIPRTPDGKPNLTAPAPRTPDGKPDLSGLWGLNPGAYMTNIAVDLAPGDIDPKATALRKQRMEDLFKDDPNSWQCLPHGPRADLLPFLMSRIVQTPSLMVILSEDLTYRQIFLDGRALPKDPSPSFMGYSVGRWEGDTLVVESIGFNDRTWIDFSGYPHTEALKITEHFRRTDFGHMEIRATFEDPAIYRKPLVVPIQATFAPDTEMLEYVCNENEKDKTHIVGKASDDLKYAIKVSPEVFARYTGAYEFKFPESPQSPIVYNITQSGGELFVDTEGKDRWKLIPLSETMYSWMGDRLEFRKDDKGMFHIFFLAAEGDLPAFRKK